MNTYAANKIRKNGFTLVEVIVVAVIVLILSAVAIPMYNGFVNQARKDTADNLAETTAAAANAMYRRMGTAAEADIAAGGFVGEHTPNQPPLRISFDNNKHTVTITTSGVLVADKNNASINGAAAYK